MWAVHGAATRALTAPTELAIPGQGPSGVLSAALGVGYSEEKIQMCQVELSRGEWGVLGVGCGLCAEEDWRGVVHGLADAEGALECFICGQEKPSLAAVFSPPGL